MSTQMKLKWRLSYVLISSFAISPALAQNQTVDSHIGKLEFTHDFANGYPTKETVEKLYDERDFQRACQLYLWSLPAVSFAEWQHGQESIGAKSGDVGQFLRQRLDQVIQREPIDERDRFFHAMLQPLGMEKGKPFKPNARQTKILTDAVLVGEAMAKANTFERRFAGMMYRPDARWHYALALDADNPDAFWYLLDERAAWFYEAVSASPDMAPKHPGPSSAYLGAYTDKSGDWLDGANYYKLHVPPNAPAKLFWSVTLYDVDTRSLIINEQKIADRSSRMNLKKNADGSVDIYCGPTAPAVFESNWIPTVAGKSWFAYFRLYEPTETYFDTSWPLGDFERIK
jgi:hypothetical protein